MSDTTPHSGGQRVRETVAERVDGDAGELLDRRAVRAFHGARLVWPGRQQMQQR